MDRRTVTNSLLTSSAVVALFGLVAKRIGIPWVTDILALAKIPGVEISWDGIWLIVLVTAAITLLFFNAQKMQRAISKWRESRKRYWTLNFCDAVQYIAFQSYFGQAWQPDKRWAFAAGALYEEARCGRIDIAGLPEHSLALAKIPKRIFDGTSRLDLSGCQMESKNALLRKHDKGPILFSALTLDKYQVHKRWPQKPSSIW